MPRLAALIILIAAVAAAALAAEPPQLPPHPRLLLNRDGIARFKEKITQEPWRAQWVKSLKAMDKAARKKVELPPRGGNWSHNYVCPEHGARLTQGRRIGPWQWEHKCPVGPHIRLGDKSKATLDHDGNGIAGVHADNAEMLRDLGLAWQVTGERRYADAARALLLAYAEKYLQYPRHDNQGKPVRKKGTGGRIASQSLTEASWLIPMTQGADLIWETLSAAERQAVTARLLRPALDETVLNNSKKPTIHNIQCRRNSAVGLVGLLLGDRVLIDHAIDGIHGYRANMAQGVQADGVWYEGSWGYHFFTLDGVWPLTEAARNCGIDLYGPELRRMFDAPLQLAMPNRRLPAFNDSSEVAIGSRSEIYEVAFARYHDPAYGALLAGGKRSGGLALWYGEPRISGADSPKAGSHSAEASGYTILQRGDGAQATWLCVKYGPHGGGHGHYDKNNFVLYAGGEIVAPDPGSHAYGSPLHKDWDKTSFAHNTLVVDQASQAQATGKQLCFGSEDGVDYVMTDAGAIYPGVRFVRTAALVNPRLLVFVDHVRAETTRTLDLVCHLYGQWEGAPSGKPFTAPQAPGYSYIKDGLSRPGQAGIVLAGRTDAECQPYKLALASSDAPTEVITGTGVGASTEQRVPLAIFRRVAREAVYVWAISLDSEPAALKANTAAGDATTVAVTAHGKTLNLTADPIRGTVKVAGD